MKLACPICTEGDYRPICRASRQPAILNRLYSSRENAVQAQTVDLQFVGCSNCRFVWNAAFDEHAIHYAPGYLNDQTYSTVFCDHVEGVVNQLCALASQREGVVVEIGCGQGNVLRRVSDATRRAGFGFDPAYTGPERVGNVVFAPDLFTANSLQAVKHHSVSLIFARHVLEHVPNPKLMLNALAQINNVQLFLEVPCFNWIASNSAFYDLFHEHCSLFNAQSFTTLLNDVGLGDVHVQPAFGGQYLTAHSMGDCRGPIESVNEATSRDSFDEIAARLEEERSHWYDTINALISKGPVLVWGAGAKGISFVNHLGFDHTVIPFIVDVHPRKQGMYVSVTGQRVIAPEEIREVVEAQHIEPTIIVMNSNYRTEIKRTLHELGMTANVLIVSHRSVLEVHR